MEQTEKQRDDRLSLKIKIKSLTEEARIIRKEERKLDCTVQEERYKQISLIHHRKQVVRPESRKTLAAYGYIRGRAYYQIELNGNPETLHWGGVQRMVEKYGPQPYNAGAFEAWKKEACKGICTPPIA